MHCVILVDLCLHTHTDCICFSSIQFRKKKITQQELLAEANAVDRARFKPEDFAALTATATGGTNAPQPLSARR